MVEKLRVAKQARDFLLRSWPCTSAAQLASTHRNLDRMQLIVQLCSGVIGVVVAAARQLDMHRAELNSTMDLQKHKTIASVLPRQRG